MPRQSEIVKYPVELLAFIHQCLDDPKITQAETIKKVNALILDKYLNENELTTGSLGRYAKKRREKFEKAVQVMAQQKAQRDEFFARFGDDGLDNAGRYATEMLYSFMMKMQTALFSVQSLFDDGKVDVGMLDVLSKVIQRISASIGNLEKSLTENKSRVDQIKQEAKAEALVEAAKAMESQAKELNQSEDVTVALRKAIMSGLKNV